MARVNRKSILIDGCYAHVMSRATEKRYIFRTDADFEKFKEFLQESKDRFSFRIHHYCLMHTHFHLVVSMDNVKQFSEGMKWVKWQYARYYNFSEQRFGPLWRDRFRSRIIQDERYMQACGLYVEANPVESGLVRRCEDWTYSSSRYYLRGEKDSLVDAYSYDGEPIKPAVEIESDKRTIGTEIFRMLHNEGVFNAD